MSEKSLLALVGPWSPVEKLNINYAARGANWDRYGNSELSMVYSEPLIQTGGEAVAGPVVGVLPRPRFSCGTDRSVLS